MPAHPGVIRPSGETQTISVITRPAPPSALPPRWIIRKSVGIPSPSETYMSIGETTTRLFSSSSPSRKGWNIGGVSGRPCGVLRVNHSSSRCTNSGSRTLRLSWVTRRLRVMMLNANCSGSWCRY